MAINYHEMLDDIIRRIQDDDTAHSATVDALVQRLRQLQALGMGEMLDRRIDTEGGIEGGGDLQQDRTLRLSEGVVEALRLAQDSLQEDDLQGYLTGQEIAERYATKTDARQVTYLPYSHPGAVVGSVSSPRVGVPVAGTITHMTVMVTDTGAALTVRLTGGAEGEMILPAGESTRTVQVDAEITSPVGIALQSSGVSGVVVTLRVREDTE